MEKLIVESARCWIGTKFQFYGRKKKDDTSLGGVDCAGLILCVGYDLRLLSVPISDYPKYPDRSFVHDLCLAYLEPISLDTIQTGTIVLLKWGKSAAHLGIIGSYNNELTLIHAHAQSRCVVEQRLETEWKERIVAAFKYKC